MLLCVVEKLQHIIADDNTGLAGKNVLDTHVCRVVFLKNDTFMSERSCEKQIKKSVSVKELFVGRQETFVFVEGCVCKEYCCPANGGGFMTSGKGAMAIGQCHRDRSGNLLTANKRLLF